MTIRRLEAACLAAGPLLFAASTFFWTDGRLGVTGGTLAVLALVPWAYGIVALLRELAGPAPRFAAVTLLVTLLGVVGGAGFGYQGFFEAAFGLTEQESLDAVAAYPVQAQLLLWLPGPAFPLALVLLGAGLWRARLAPVPVAALLIAGAMAFPLSRIPREVWLAHAVDLLLAVPFLVLALRWWRTGQATGRA